MMKMNRISSVVGMMIMMAFAGTSNLIADETVRVTSIVNGSTIVVSTGDTIKLIGVEPRQSESDGTFAVEDDKDMRDYLELAIGGAEVKLSSDRNLKADHANFRYVTADGKLINRELIEAGYASAASRYEYERRQDFTAVEKEARSTFSGGWGIDREYVENETNTLTAGRFELR